MAGLSVTSQIVCDVWNVYYMSLIEPAILKGTRDFAPEEMRKRLFVIDTMREIFERRGYDPIETPAIEYAKTILGKYGDEGDQLTYTFKDHGGRAIALRYDQTVPTARFVAAHQNELPFPFKRYQIGPVWRADKPQKGRYREFVQCDIDIIGAESLLADAEVARVIFEVFSRLKVKDFVIRINSRKAINDLLDACKVKKNSRIDVIRLIDKLDKVPLKKIQSELEKTSMTTDQVVKLTDMALSEKTRNRIDQLPDGEGKSELKQLFVYLEALGIPEEHVMVDLTLARGLDYYTGVIYEVIVPNSGLGSLCGGGRYDDLTGLFSEKKFPGIGVAFGLDRIVELLKDRGLLDDAKLSSSEALVAHFPDTVKESVAVLNELQKAGIRSELYLEPVPLKKQFKFADKKQIKWMLLLGSNEAKQKKVVLRNMETGKQELLTLQKAIKIMQK